MKCPHCSVSFHDSWAETGFPTKIQDGVGLWDFRWSTCPACVRIIIQLVHLPNGQANERSNYRYVTVHPRSSARPPLPTDVPNEFSSDYEEACLVLADSPKASAALSRRCLQNLIRQRFGIARRDLAAEIDELLPRLPAYLAEQVDVIRNIGNFAAHPTKSSEPSVIVEVEPGEAEWCLDVLEGLFDFCFVQPARVAERKDALNQKLRDAGKPPMK